MNGPPVKLVEQLCPSCNAPLQVGPLDTVVTCRYCNRSITIQRAKPPRPPTPRVDQFGAMPPPPSTVLYIQPAVSAGARIIPVLVALVIMVIAGGSTLVAALVRRTAGLSGGSHTTLPMQCETNDTLTISDRTFDGHGPLVQGGINCKLTLKNCTLQSTDPIVAGGTNLELHLVHTKLTSKASALDLGINSKVWLSEGSEIHADEVGIKADSNLELDSKGSTIQGGTAGIESTSNATMALVDTQVSGKEQGIKGTSSIKLKLRGGSVKSEQVAVELESSGNIDAQGAAIGGAERGIVMTSSAEIKLSKKASVSSAKGDALALGSSAKLTVDDAQITGAQVAVQADQNAEVRLKNGAAVKGNAGGLVVKSNLKLIMDGGKLESRGPALFGDSNADVRASGGSINGNPALLFSGEPSHLDLTGATIVGAQRFDNRGGFPAGPTSTPSNRGGFPAGPTSTPSDSGGDSTARILAKFKSEVQHCADQKVAKGDLTVKVVVAPGGTVQAVQVLSSTVPKWLETCSVARLRALVFPARAGTAGYVQSYSFQ